MNAIIRNPFDAGNRRRPVLPSLSHPLSMTSIPSHSHRTLRFPLARAICAGGCLAALWTPRASAAEGANNDWTRNFRLGVQLLFNVKTDLGLLMD